MTKPDAFLSYTRFDNQYHHGAISEFRDRLSMAVRAVTAQPFEIFQDLDGIGLGEVWREVLNDKLDQARFFIPILTPNYFSSEACRDELKKFVELERTSGRNDLILPIYYLTCVVLEDRERCAADSVAMLIDGRQRWDWRDLRHHSFRTKKVKLELEAIANQIDGARRRVMLLSLDEFKAQLRIADIVGRYVKLTRRGREYLGLCPFHREKTPSFTVSEAKGFYHCFGCGQHGNAIDFVMGIEGLDFDQAVTRLEKLMGLPRPNRGGPTGPTGTVRGAARIEPGTAFRDIAAPWCPEMVVIPPGEFMMGSTEAERQWAVDRGAKREWVDSERPRHLVRIAYHLAVACYPATLAEYEHFCERTRRQPPNDAEWGRSREPVTNVSWHDARAYVEWLAAETGHPYRLLSEAEWEYACRAGTTTRYWWGDEITSENANYAGSRIGKPSEVGRYPANPWGLHDTHGNVWEWVEDVWNGTYQGAPTNGSAWFAGKNSRHVLRGGSWNNEPRSVRSATRFRYDPVDQNGYIGFRVARAFAP